MGSEMCIRDRTTKIQTGAKRSNLVPMATGTGIRVKIKKNTWIYVNEAMNDFENANQIVVETTGKKGSQAKLGKARSVR